MEVTTMSTSIRLPRTKPLKLLAGTAVAALLIGGAAGVGAQTNPEPLAQQQASLPLGHNDVREVQNQLIALGFDPGPVDGQVGPATTGAAQQYDQSRGGSGQVSVDGALLARLKADTAPRLTYEQVAARSQARQPARTQALSAGSNQFGGIVQQIVPLIGAAIANSNNNNNSYGPGYYGPGPGYYGPGPGYYGPGPGYGYRYRGY
jgi:peptidoglycan hydrolase-like protein with peptidoglycan-binding domain